MTNIQAVLSAMRRVIRAADIHSKRLTKTCGLTAPQLLLLQAIDQHADDPTIGTLAKEISLSQATLSNIVDRLESRNFLIRRRSESDKRYITLHMTEKGKEVLKGAPTPLQAQFVERFNQLEDWEQNMILSSLQRVAQMMDAEALDASPFLEVGPLDRTDSQGPEKM